MNRDSSARVSAKKEAILSYRNSFGLSFVSILMINWIGNFQLFDGFGLYIDDYFRIPVLMQAMQENPNAVFSTIFSSPLNIRPLHGTFIYLMSFVGLNMGGLGGIYVIAFIILSMNAVLCYLLIYRITGSVVYPFVGASILLLYPVTTVKVWLTAALGIQPALALILLALISYVYNKRSISYILLTLSLFCYETFYWIFLAAPLLANQWNRKLFKQLLSNGTYLCAIFAGFFILKSFSSDPRLINSNIYDLIGTSLKHLIEGPYYNLIGNIKILLKTLIGMNSKDVFIGGVLSLILFIVLSILWNWKERYDSVNIEGGKEERGLNSFQLVIIGLIMLFLAYPITFLGNVRTIYGIGSRLHLAGIIGIAFLYSGLSAMILKYIDRTKTKIIGFICISAGISLMMIYNFHVQQDYREAGRNQIIFWRDLDKISTELEDGTLIFFYPDKQRNVNSISSFDWSTSFVLDKLYEFPKDWTNTPNVYVVNKAGLEQYIMLNDNLTLSILEDKDFINVVKIADNDRKVEKHKVIFLHYENDELKRIKSIGGFKFEDSENKLHQKAHIRFPKGVLYNLLVNNKLLSNAS